MRPIYIYRNNSTEAAENKPWIRNKTKHDKNKIDKPKNKSISVL